jgi:hypothetical protein
MDGKYQRRLAGPVRANLREALEGRDFALADKKTILEERIGTGDICYAVGLFQLLAGKKRNLPIVHTGNLALTAGEEAIPVRDWHCYPQRGKIRYVEGHLVELQNLKGLSGSPVFVRASHDILDLPTDAGGTANIRVSRNDIHLLGVWQSSWDAPRVRCWVCNRVQSSVSPSGSGVWFLLGN